MEVINSTTQDFSAIFELYDMAVAHQKKVSNKHWKGFSEALIHKEIQENRQYKIIIDERIACIFAITFNDPEIWGEKDQEPSVYIHRIATHPDFRGKAFVKTIINWAKQYAKNHQLRYVRMDTWADNLKLLSYYTNCGFKHVGVVTPDANSGLPKHYEGISLNLFEIEA